MDNLKPRGRIPLRIGGIVITLVGFFLLAYLMQSVLNAIPSISQGIEPTWWYIAVVVVVILLVLFTGVMAIVSSIRPVFSTPLLVMANIIGCGVLILCVRGVMGFVSSVLLYLSIGAGLDSGLAFLGAIITLIAYFAVLIACILVVIGISLNKKQG